MQQMRVKYTVPEKKVVLTYVPSALVDEKPLPDASGLLKNGDLVKAYEINSDFFLAAHSGDLFSDY